MAEGNFDINIREEDSYVGELDSVRLSLDRIISNLRDTLLQISQSAEQVAAGSEQVSSGAVMAVEWATMLLVFPMITKGLFKNSAAFSTICSRLSPFSEAWTSCHFFV